MPEEVEQGTDVTPEETAEDFEDALSVIPGDLTGEQAKGAMEDLISSKGNQDTLERTYEIDSSKETDDFDVVPDRFLKKPLSEEKSAQPAVAATEKPQPQGKVMYSPEEMRTLSPDEVDTSRIPAEQMGFYKAMQAGFTKNQQRRMDELKEQQAAVDKQRREMDEWRFRQDEYQRQQQQQEQQKRHEEDDELLDPELREERQARRTLQSEMESMKQRQQQFEEQDRRRQQMEEERAINRDLDAAVDAAGLPQDDTVRKSFRDSLEKETYAEWDLAYKQRRQYPTISEVAERVSQKFQAFTAPDKMEKFVRDNYPELIKKFNNENLSNLRVKKTVAAKTVSPSSAGIEIKSAKPELPTEIDDLDQITPYIKDSLRSLGLK